MSGKYWVYHEDDYPDMGGVELVMFDTREEAEEFILDRVTSSPNRKLSMYTVIHGERLEISEAEVIKKVKIND